MVEGVAIIVAGSIVGDLTVLLLLLAAVITITTACLKFKTNNAEYNSKTSTEGDIITTPMLLTSEQLLLILSLK